jgi:hypothetical protein
MDEEEAVAAQAARMATRESKRIAPEGKLKATHENANKYQAKFDRLFKVCLPPDEVYNLNLCVHEEVYISSSKPSDSILYPKIGATMGQNQRPGTTDPGR